MRRREMERRKRQALACHIRSRDLYEESNKEFWRGIGILRDLLSDLKKKAWDKAQRQSIGAHVPREKAGSGGGAGSTMPVQGPEPALAREMREAAK